MSERQRSTGRAQEAPVAGYLGLRDYVRSVPRGLLLLTFAVLAHNVVWIVALPAWQGPDEFSHYAYVERIAADHRLMPLDRTSDPPRNSVAGDDSFAATGFSALRFRAPIRPFGAAGADPALFLHELADLPQHNTGELGANNYPPAYYVAALPLFELPGLSNATQRDYTIRLLSALLGALLVPLTFRLARAAMLSARTSLLAAGLATAPPILTQQSAVFSPDVLLAVAITGLALAVLRAGKCLDRRRIAAAIAWAALASLTKPVGLPAAAAIAGTIAILTFGRLKARTRVGLLAGTSFVALVVGGVFASTLFRVAVPDSYSWLTRIRFGGEYLWQYYLPRPTWMPVVVPPATPASPPAEWMWGKESIGILGWLTTLLPAWTYRLAQIPMVLAAGVAFAGAMFGSRSRVNRGAIGALAVAAIAYILVLHAAEASYLLSNGNRLLQGRYFLPAYPLFAVALMGGLSRFGERIAISIGLALWAVWTLVALSALNTIVIYFG